MITEADIERALDWMRDNAEKMAKAKADRVTLENYKSVIKAELMSERVSDPVNAQERHAYSHPSYKNHLEAIRIAIEEDERLKFLYEAAQVKISYWQTWSKNQRGGL